MTTDEPWKPIWWQADPEADVVCQHGTAIDVHCCNCHHGFLFTPDSCVCVFNDPDDSGESVEQENAA